MKTVELQHLLAFCASRYGIDCDPGTCDDIWGDQTHKAVAAFQRAYGITADGYPGNQTYKALADAIAYGMPAIDKDALAPADAVADQTETASAASDDAAQYLQADGCYHIPRGVDVQLTAHFRASEIHCQGHGCCTESVISKRIMDLAEEIRVDLGKPITIGTAGGSGYRCPKHNAETPGSSATSLHTISDAVDMHYASPATLKAVAMRHLTDGEIGVYSWGCHVGRWDRGYVSEFSGGS